MAQRKTEVRDKYDGICFYKVEEWTEAEHGEITGLEQEILFQYSKHAKINIETGSIHTERNSLLILDETGTQTASFLISNMR